MIDTLITEKNGQYILERYKGQNLDEYEHVFECNHSKLIEYKVNNNYFFKTIPYDAIYNYLINEFDYKF